MKLFVQFVLLMLLSCNDPCCSERTFIPGCDQTNEGNEFFVGFFRNRFGRTDEPEVIPPVLWITTKESMPVNFTVSTFFGLLTSGVATPGEITYVDIPLGFIVFDSSEDSETDTRFKGICIKAEDDRRIIVFGQNEEVASNDAYLALPIISLPAGRSYEYIAASIFGDSGTVAQQKDSVTLIIGTENDTEIILEPSVIISHPFAPTRQFIPGAPVQLRTVTIQRFQTFYLEVRGGDISGTRIIANKPISVFSGHECANVPLASVPCDILIEQLQPIDTWGAEVVTVPLSTRSGDVLKVFASQDSTTVNVTYTNISSGMVTSDSFSFTLNRNGFRELGGTSMELTGAIADFALIQSNNPIAVFQFSRSFSTDNNIISDPFMLSVPSCEQYRNSYAVAPAPFNETIEGTVPGRVAYVNYTNIAVPAEYFNASLITVNNNPINASEFRPIRRADNSIWGYGAQLELDGVAIISHSDPNAALSVTLYGFSNQMSWGCTGGTGLAPVALSVVSFETNGGSGVTIVMSESAGPLVVVLVLSDAVDEDVSVFVIATNITARAGEDFGPYQNYTVTFPAGSTRQSVNIPIINDTVLELDETFQLELSIPEAAVRAGVIDGCDPISSRQTVEIIDDDQTNEGNEFFVGFFRNRFGRLDEAEVIPPVLWITTKESMPVNFTVSTFFGLLTSGVATPGEITYVDIPLGFIVFDSSVDSTIDSRFKGIRIKAEDDRRIAVFGQHEEVASNDAYLALPIILLPAGRSYEYIAASIFGDAGTVAQAKDSVTLIIGTENDTEITLEPSRTIRHPLAPAVTRGRFIPGVPYQSRTVTIQRFQTFYLQVRGGDISGTRIISNKPISVFSGHECANVPLASEPCDILIEQLQPIDTWGTEAVIVPLRTRSGDVLKVFASQDSTTVNVTYTNISSGLVTSNSFRFTLNRNGFRELGGTSIVATGAIADFTLIQSNNPIAVFQFSRSFSTDNNIISDPFMLSVPSCEQYRNNYAVAPAPFDPSIEGTTASGRVAYINYTNIAVPAEYFNASLITINNNPINASEFRPIRRADNSVWGYGAQLLLDEGAQVIRHQDPNAALSVTLYGFSNQMSWGCTGGTGLAPVPFAVSVLVSFVRSTYSVDEDAGPAQLVLVLSNPTSLEFNVTVFNTDGSATGGSTIGGGVDYISGPYTVTFPAGVAGVLFDIAINDDDVLESIENFMLTINSSSLPTGVTVGSTGQATLTIVDDDSEEICSVTSISGKVNHNQTRKRTKFRFSSDGNLGVTYQCKLDDGKFKDCKSPKVWRKLKRGRHTIAVRAFCIDDEGKRFSTVTRNFKLRVC